MLLHPHQAKRFCMRRPGEQSRPALARSGTGRRLGGKWQGTRCALLFTEVQMMRCDSSHRLVDGEYAPMLNSNVIHEVCPWSKKRAAENSCSTSNITSFCIIIRRGEVKQRRSERKHETGGSKTGEKKKEYDVHTYTYKPNGSTRRHYRCGISVHQLSVHDQVSSFLTRYWSALFYIVSSSFDARRHSFITE